MTLRFLSCTRAFAALAVLLVGSAFARAEVILDDFTTPTPGTDFAIAGSNTNPFTNTANLAGGTVRSTTLTVTSSNPGASSLTGIIGGGNFGMFLDSTSSGNAVINYVLGSPINLSGIGGSAGAIRLGSQSSATVGNPDVAFTLSVQTATGTLSTTGSFVNSAGFVNQDVAFSSYTGTGDLTQVTGLTLTVTAQVADDFRLNKIAVTEPDVQQVPAPPAVLLALVALPVLGFRRYFGRKA